MTEIERIDSIISKLKQLKSNKLKLSKLSDKDYRSMTRKAISNNNAEKDFTAMDNIKKLHEIHALAVELGFAEFRPSYEAIELNDGWHRYSYKPPEPFSN